MNDKETTPNVVVVMGVSGAGKTAVGQALADATGWRFVEGDAYHPASNIEKMSHGIGLTDEDRRPWLAALRDVVEQVVREDDHAILACSALKHDYRETLRVPNAGRAVRFVFLDVPPEVLAQRLAERKHHFAPPELLHSQLATLEKPRDALRVDGARPIPEIVEQVVNELRLPERGHA
ncbi:MAG TPA: gluconokinase [Gemmatimonadaceae bacterium]|nr:gluconokinase [Gemmatimonadaceae bacterium]